MNYKNIITVFLIISTFQLFSQTETEITSKIKSVTVYQKGAVIQSETKTMLKSGINRISIVGIPQQINTKSVQVTGIGNFTIISVKTGFTYVEKETATKLRREKAYAKKDSILFQLKVQNAYLEAARLEETMLLANNKIGGNQTGVSLLELKQIALYFTQTMTQIKQKQKQINAKIYSLNLELNRTHELINLSGEKEQLYSKIDIELNAPIQTNATLNIEYLAYNAGWTPLYDIRVNDLTGKINLSHKAQIYQNTGADWNNVALTVSTGNPMINSEKPIVKKRYVDAYVKQKRVKNYRKTTEATASYAGVEGNDGQMGSVRGARTDGTVTYVDGVSVGRTVLPIQNTTTVEFVIDVPYSIGSNNKPYLVDIKKYVFDANYEIYAAPELDLSAYLTAQTTGLDGNGFESGDMNIFLGGSFIGTVDFDPLSTNDTLVLSLGKDKSTSIERKRTNDFSKTKVMSNAVEETYEYTIKVKNTRDYPVKVKIEEQIPIAKSDEITVNIISIGDAKQDTETGILTWALNMKAKETITLKYIYTLKRPKDRKVDVVF